jgi:hypothetical protein
VGIDAHVPVYNWLQQLRPIFTLSILFNLHTGPYMIVSFSCGSKDSDYSISDSREPGLQSFLCTDTQIWLFLVEPKTQITQFLIHVNLAFNLYPFLYTDTQIWLFRVEPKTQITQFLIHVNLAFNLYPFLCTDTQIWLFLVEAKTQITQFLIHVNLTLNLYPVLFIRHYTLYLLILLVTWSKNPVNLTSPYPGEVRPCQFYC